MDDIRKELFYEQKNGYDLIDAQERPALEDYCRDIRALKAGRSVPRRGYDYVNHCRKDPGGKLRPAPVLLLEGIHVFYDKRVRSLCDLKVFLQVDPDLCLLRRIARDLRDRGRTIEDISRQYLSATANIMRHTDHGAVDVRVVSASGETLAEVNLADFLADNPEVDCTKQEVLIPIYIEFKSGEVVVSLPEWYVQEVKPEF